jgi:hypothetical protein
MLQLLADARPRRLDPGPRPADPAAMMAHPQDVGGAASAREPRVEGLLAPRPRWSRLRWRLGLTAAVVVALRSARQGAPTLVSRMWVRADGKQMAGFRGPESTIIVDRPGQTG